MNKLFGTSTEYSEPTSLTMADFEKALDLVRTKVYYAVDKSNTLEKGEAYKVSPENQVSFFVIREDDFAELEKELYYRVKFIHIREAPVTYRYDGLDLKVKEIFE